MTCGHTHLPLVSWHDGLLYVNSGTWTEFPPCPFVAVRGTEVRLEHWPLAEAESRDVEPTEQQEMEAQPIALHESVPPS